MTLAVASMTLTACFEEPSPHDAIRDFLVGWKEEDYALAAGRTDADPKAVAKALADAKLDLDATSFRFKIKNVARSGGQARADFTAEVDLGENNPLWVYDGTLPLRLVDGVWKVRWSPSVLHPRLQPGQRFAVQVKPLSRRPIVDRDGAALQQDTTLYVAGVVPSRLGDRAEEVAAQLSALTGYASDRLLSKIRSAPPSDFVPLVTLGRLRYAQLEARLKAIEGIEIDPQKHPFAPADPKQIIGTVSTLTAEGEQRLGGPQRAGDSIGRTGLQKAYQDYLTGSTVTRVITLDLQTGRQVAQLHELAGQRDAVEVHTTIDSALQQAAQTAVTGTQSSVLVAVDAANGHIRAVASEGMAQDKHGLGGRFPAGTAMSIVATDALIKAGVQLGLKVRCVPERTVGGARFRYAGLPPTTETFLNGFASGCVTALAALARRVKAADLTKSAQIFGIEGPWTLPLRSFSGSWPALSGDADKAMAIAGQNVEVSPLSMALVAAAVADGTWHPPVLVTKPASPAPAQPQTLDPQVHAALKAMMRAGVVSGTARAAGATPGVHGIRADVPGKDLSWFVGWQGGVAVAVLAEKTDPSAIAGRFFSAVRDVS
ncbi:NTF2-like N-terminal transpeptidase domain-containing protein [Thermoactinospora rubra]|uniref:NTF2-like N-terminal transpeptidase domain-containing protein n=1 Tax=Thermoactinospora rubra TaxID=1088767 RepID=UPI001F0B08BB|nr:NTF2-like N-terminal transpeptidase domain-containing protein [Thermoactinospora rubra]